MDWLELSELKRIRIPLVQQKFSKTIVERMLEPAMKVDEKDLDKINKKMIGWTVDKVESGTAGETVFIIHLSKGENKRTVQLCANDLGGWLK